MINQNAELLRQTKEAVEHFAKVLQNVKKDQTTGITPERISQILKLHTER